MVNKTFNQKPGFYGFFRLCKGKSFTYVHWVWLDFLASDFKFILQSAYGGQDWV